MFKNSKSLIDSIDSIDKFNASVHGNEKLHPEIEIRYLTVKNIDGIDKLQPLDKRTWLRVLDHYKRIYPNVQSVPTIDNTFSFTPSKGFTPSVIVSDNLISKERVYRRKTKVDAI